MRKRLEKEIFSVDGRKKQEYKVKRNINFVPTTYVDHSAMSPIKNKNKSKKLEISIEDVSNDSSDG